jgi:indolepyruvate ferredoxin oxidoreductase alpha subunit
MTGFQPHPGTGLNAAGDHAPVVDIEALCRSLGCEVEVGDPFDLEGTQKKLLKLLEEEGKVRVLILRRKCALIQMREDGALYKVWVEQERCKGEDCGCARFCTRVFKCPALVWEREAGKARVDKALCTGCGVCSDICPEGAIAREVEP